MQTGAQYIRAFFKANFDVRVYVCPSCLLTCTDANAQDHFEISDDLKTLTCNDCSYSFDHPERSL